MSSVKVSGACAVAARWLGETSPMPVVMAAHGRRLVPGTVHVAPAGMNTVLRRGLRRRRRVAASRELAATRAAEEEALVPPQQVAASVLELPRALLEVGDHRFERVGEQGDERLGVAGHRWRQRTAEPQLRGRGMGGARFRRTLLRTMDRAAR